MQIASVELKLANEVIWFSMEFVFMQLHLLHFVHCPVNYYNTMSSIIRDTNRQLFTGQYNEQYNKRLEKTVVHRTMQ
jgi:hypothetical protein